MTTNSVEHKKTESKGTGQNTRVKKPVSLIIPVHNTLAVPFVVIGIALAIGAGIAVNFTYSVPPLLLLTGAVGLFIAIAIFQKPELGAYILIFSVFTNLSDLFTEKGLPSINKPLVALVVFSIFANYILKTGKLSSLPKITTAEFVLGAYLLSVASSAFMAVDQTKSFTAIFDLLKDIAVGYCIYTALDSKEKIKTGIEVLLMAVAFVSMLGVVHTVTGSSNTFWGFAQRSAFGQISDSDGQLRYAGPLGESNIWGQVLVSVIPVAIYLFTKTREPIGKSVYGIAGSFILLAMIFTESRGAVVALALILTLIAIDLRIKSSTILLATTGILVMLFALPDKYAQRIKSLDIFFQNQENSYTGDEAISGRRTRMLVGLSMFSKNPFLGVGFANYSENYLTYAENLGLESASLGGTGEDTQQQPHSLYVEIAAETGLFGLSTFLLFLSLILRELYQMRKQTKKSGHWAEQDWSMLAAAIMMSIITFLIAGFFLHGIGFRFIWVLIGIALAFGRFYSKQAVLGVPV